MGASSKQYILLGAIFGFLACLFIIQTLEGFNENDARIRKYLAQMHSSQKQSQADTYGPLTRFFTSKLPAEWGAGEKKTDPYTFSIYDSKDAEDQVEKQPSNAGKETEVQKEGENKQVVSDEQNAYEKHYKNIITREALGNMGWTLLHMISSTYPVEVTKEFVDRTNLFLNLFGQFYPCKECAQHFLEMTSNRQFEGRSRGEFMKYVCGLHNTVNVRLGKEEFDCDKLEERWGGNCGCSSSPPQTEEPPSL